MSDTIKRCDWIVRCYDKDDNVTAKWKIENRTEHEAENEAMGSPEVKSAADWTMTEIPVTFSNAPTL